MNMVDPRGRDLSGSYLFADWPAKPASVHAVTSLRAGGYSTGPYSSFNLAAHVEDDSEAVMANRKKLSGKPSFMARLEQQPP